MEFNVTLKERRWLMLHKNGRRTHHLHLVVYEQSEWRRRLAFRDALRNDNVWLFGGFCAAMRIF